MKVYLANKSWYGEYLELVEQPICVFANLEKAKKACVDKFILEETARCSNPKTPDIYVKEWNLAKENPEQFIKDFILVYKEDINGKEFEKLFNMQHFTIIEMELIDA
jgi:hypothetical protein